MVVSYPRMSVYHDKCQHRHILTFQSPACQPGPCRTRPMLQDHRIRSCHLEHEHVFDMFSSLLGVRLATASNTLLQPRLFRGSSSLRNPTCL